MERIRCSIQMEITETKTEINCRQNEQILKSNLDRNKSFFPYNGVLNNVNTSKNSANYLTSHFS